MKPGFRAVQRCSMHVEMLVVNGSGGLRNLARDRDLRISNFAFFANLQFSIFAISLRDYGWGKTRDSVGL